jgi:hypothetical protein
MKTENMTSTNGNKVANQFTITDDNGNTFFQSYSSIIVKINSGDGNYDVELDQKYWNYSNTTGKYRNIFLNETIKDTRKKIKSGEYKLVDLNINNKVHYHDKLDENGITINA